MSHFLYQNIRVIDVLHHIMYIGVCWPWLPLMVFLAIDKFLTFLFASVMI